MELPKTKQEGMPGIHFMQSSTVTCGAQEDAGKIAVQKFTNRSSENAR